MKAAAATSWQIIDACVEAFEAARQRDAAAPLAGFLPGRADPLYLPVLRELVRVDLELGWESGRRPSLESYRGPHAELFGDAGSMRAIAFEEYRLRRQYGDDPDPIEYARRYDLQVLDDAAASALPLTRVLTEGAAAAGDVSVPGHPQLDSLAAVDTALTGLPSRSLLGFELVHELGRGAFGRVFLARQPELAHRPVVLKIAAELWHESQALAQLQHTYIMPILSLHRCGSLQAVCMPYFGATTLAQAVTSMRSQHMIPQSGRVFVSTVRAAARGTQVGVREPSGTNGSAPAWPLPTAIGWPERDDVATVLYIGACLAEGLDHAHTRGIVHGDLKPANILLTDDGRPMLLDFHLAVDTKLRDTPDGAMIGGTLPYMSPEQLSAFATGLRQPEPRSDIYALGVILFELLAGRLPHALPAGAPRDIIEPLRLARLGPVPRLRPSNPSVTPATEAIVRRCLAPDPAERYPSAAALREDLQRQLDHLPLKHTREPSLRERLGKWRRRHPRLSSGTTVALAAVVLLASLSAALIARQRHVETLEAVQGLLSLHESASGLAVRLARSDAPPSEIAAALADCRAALAPFQLEEPSWRQRPRVSRLTDAQQQELKRTLAEILLVEARGLAWQAEVGESAGARRLRDALLRNQQAEASLDTAPRALWLQRAKLLRRLGATTEADDAARRAQETPATSAADRWLLVLEEMDRGRFRDHLAFLREACRQQGRNPQVWVALGNCFAGLGKLTDAVLCYETASALQPSAPAPPFYRGLTNLERKDYAAAVDDFTRVLELRPGLHEALVNRGLAYLQGKQPAKALDDFTSAMDAGAPFRRNNFRRQPESRARDHPGQRQRHLPRASCQPETGRELLPRSRGAGQRRQLHPRRRRHAASSQLDHVHGRYARCRTTECRLPTLCCPEPAFQLAADDTNRRPRRRRCHGDLQQPSAAGVDADRAGQHDSFRAKRLLDAGYLHRAFPQARRWTDQLHAARRRPHRTDRSRPR